MQVVKFEQEHALLAGSDGGQSLARPTNYQPGSDPFDF